MSEVARRSDTTARVLVIPQEPTAEQYRDALSRLASLDSRSRGRVLAVAAALNSDPDRLVEGERTSPGEMRKLMLGLGILDEPELIIMDEPFVGLDPKAAHLLKGMMRELCDVGGAIFFSTHVLEVAEKLCDKVAIIKGGRLIRSGTMEEVKGDDSLEDVFLELEDASC
mgnify:CR=1 FL=1